MGSYRSMRTLHSRLGALEDKTVVSMLRTGDTSGRSILVVTADRLTEWAEEVVRRSVRVERWPRGLSELPGRSVRTGCRPVGANDGHAGRQGWPRNKRASAAPRMGPTPTT